MKTALKRLKAVTWLTVVILSAVPLQLRAQTTAPVSQRIQAEDFDALKGVAPEPPGDKVTCVSVPNCGNGDWIRFDSVSFLTGEFDSVTICYWARNKAGNPQNTQGAIVRVRLDSPTGTIVGSISNIPQTVDYGYGPSVKWSGAMLEASGVHTVYITFEGSAIILSLDWVEFSGMATIRPEDAVVYYVDAVNGSDALNNGLSIANPFRTIQRAASVMKPGSVCKIRQGIYRETVRPVYTGASGAPLVFEAYNSEAVYISGADPVTGWTQHSGSIYKAVSPGSLGKYNDQLLVDGKMAWVARCPNVEEPYNPHRYCGYCFMGAWNFAPFRQGHEPIALPTVFCFNINGSQLPCCDFSQGKLVDFSITDEWPQTNPIPPGLLNRPADFFKGGLLTCRNYYIASHAFITGSASQAAKTVFNAQTAHDGARDGTGAGWISHLLSLLDSPNEWYRDSASNTLYLWAPDGGDPGHHLVEAKRRLLGFDLAGKQYVQLRDIRFIATAARLEDASNCVLDGCQWKYLSHYDLMWSGSWWENGAIYRSPFDPSDGHAGVFVSGTRNVIKNCLAAGSAGSGFIVTGTYNTITNCIIRDCNYAATYNAGIMLLKRDPADPEDALGNVFSHNNLSFCSRANIQVASASTPRSPQERNRVEYNDIGTSSYATTESGSINMLASAKVEIHHNWFHGVAGFSAASTSAASDYGGRNTIIHHNVFWQGKCIPSTVGEFACSRWTFDWDDSGGVDGAACFNNTLVDSSAPSHRDWDTWITPQGVPWPCTRSPFFQNNLRANSNPAPWLFTDPSNRDYSLRTGSPAIDKGVVIPSWVETFKGTAPDLGAYEFGEPRWTAGTDWQEQQWAYPPPASSAIAGRPAMLSGNPFQPKLAKVHTGLTIAAAVGKPYVVAIHGPNGKIIRIVSAPHGGRTMLTASSLGSGVYVLRAIQGDQTATWRIIICRNSI